MRRMTRHNRIFALALSLVLLTAMAAAPASAARGDSMDVGVVSSPADTAGTTSVHERPHVTPLPLIGVPVADSRIPLFFFILG